MIIDAANVETESLISEDLKKSMNADIDTDQLEKELCMLSFVIKAAAESSIKVTSLSSVIDVFKNKDNYSLKLVYSNIQVLIRLYLTVSLSNLTAERSFSALRRVKTYLRIRLTQEHFNNYLMLHVHKRLTDIIYLMNVG